MHVGYIYLHLSSFSEYPFLNKTFVSKKDVGTIDKQETILFSFFVRPLIIERKKKWPGSTDLDFLNDCSYAYLLDEHAFEITTIFTQPLYQNIEYNLNEVSGKLSIR